MFKKRLIRFVLSILATVPFVAPGSAGAADGKTYPGSICQYWTAPVSDRNAKRNKMQVSQFGWVGNDPAANFRLGVVCPLVRDSMRGGGLERVMVRGFHPNCPGGRGDECPGNTECTLRIMQGIEGPPRTPEPGTRSMVRFHSGGGPAATMLAGWTDIQIPDFTDAEDLSQGSTIVLFCRLAPGARINMIYVGEAT